MTQANPKKPPLVFESTKLTTLIGIQPNYLNRCIERRQYGIEASVRSGSGRGSRRLFDENDVFGVALVWWLSESGLRSLTIQYVLNQICGGRLNSTANDAARILLSRAAPMLVIEREPRTPANANAEHPTQKVHFFNYSEASEFVRESQTASALVIPVETLFANLKKAMLTILSSME